MWCAFMPSFLGNTKPYVRGCMAKSNNRVFTFYAVRNAASNS